MKKIFYKNFVRPLLRCLFILVKTIGFLVLLILLGAAVLALESGAFEVFLEYYGAYALVALLGVIMFMAAILKLETWQPKCLESTALKCKRR